MIIGVPKEIKPHENRIALTPAGARSFVEAGHQVLVERQGGVGSGFSDEEYISVGAQTADRADEVFQRADMIIKVKEPLLPECEMFRPGQLLFTYLHLAAVSDITRALLDRQVTAVAYETVQRDDGSLPLLTPMSEIAGRMAPQVAVHFLERPHGGRGILLSGVPGVPPGEVVIIGGGTVGTSAAKIAAGLGAHVTLMDVNLDRLRYLEDVFKTDVRTLMSNQHNVAEAVQRADVLISGVLIPGARAPNLVTEAMVAAMKPGSVIVDVAIDQGGSIETCDRVTTHDDPVYFKHDVVHYAVANMPGAVPRTSTLALTNATLPYALQLANMGFVGAIRENRELARGVNLYQGQVTYPAVAAAHGLDYVSLEQLLDA